MYGSCTGELGVELDLQYEFEAPAEPYDPMRIYCPAGCLADYSAQVRETRSEYFLQIAEIIDINQPDEPLLGRRVESTFYVPLALHEECTTWLMSYQGLYPIGWDGMCALHGKPVELRVTVMELSGDVRSASTSLIATYTLPDSLLEHCETLLSDP